MDPQLIDPSGRVVDSWSTTEGAKAQCQVAVVTQRLRSPVAPLASPPSPSVLVERSWAVRSGFGVGLPSRNRWLLDALELSRSLCVRELAA